MSKPLGGERAEDKESLYLVIANSTSLFKLLHSPTSARMRESLAGPRELGQRP